MSMPAAPQTPCFDRLRAKLTQEPATWRDRNLILVALGDSVTQGLTVNPRMLGNDAYHEALRQRLMRRFPDRAFSSINSGVGGDSVPGGLRRLQADVLDHHPDLVVVCYGLNDCGRNDAGLDAFRRDLTEMVTRIREHAAVIVMTPNMMATRDNDHVDPNYRGSVDFIVSRQTDGTLARYVQVAREVAVAAEVPLADAYAEWERRFAAGDDIVRLLTNGLNHPDAEGHGYFTDLLWSILVRELGV